MKKLYIIGESHTRQFAYRKNIVPVFMGSGKTINLDNTKLLNNKIQNVISNIKNIEDAIIFLYLGEPNCRIKLKNHWTPHWDELHKGIKIDSTPNEDYIINSIKKYEYIIMNNIDYLITPTCAYDPVIPSLKIFNKKLKDVFNEKVIDIFQHSIDEKDKVFNSFKAKDWLKDPIHLNSRICDNFIDELYNKKIIIDKSFYSKEIDGYFGTHLLRCADQSKFGSYIIKD